MAQYTTTTVSINGINTTINSGDIVEKDGISYIEPRPSALDVYRGNTELEITFVNGTPIDTIVIFKKD